MGIYSPYAVSESEQPQWKPGESLTAAAFVGIALFIILDVMWEFGESSESVQGTTTGA